MSDVGNPEFPGDHVGRPADEEANFDPYFPWNTSLFKKSKNKQEEKRESFVTEEATHILPPGHIFWFTRHEQEIGWRANEPVYLKMVRRGRWGKQSLFVVVSPQVVKITQIGGEIQGFLNKGETIYATRLKRVKSKMEKS